MTTAALKKEIRKAIDAAPESVLVEILNYLNLVNQKPGKHNLSEHLNKIMNEDNELLQKLAQ